MRFSIRDRTDCPSRGVCIRGAKGRRITLRPGEEHEALQRARQRQSTDEWQQRYAHRAGVEGAIAQGAKGFGLRRSRYRGTATTSSPAPTHRRGDEPHQDRRLADRNAAGPNPGLSFRRSASSSMMRRCFRSWVADQSKYWNAPVVTSLTRVMRSVAK
ncbi:transposase [Nonomuraea sp. NPDC049480]|uniref:transposase n=1 Tax=Nonomuraea sp. NPDC049480 TaxID=3364353 RepID=UPI0037B32839